MIELINTSVSDGLLPGTHGFATVAMTHDVPTPLRVRLEALCAYTYLSSDGDSESLCQNPVNWFHVNVSSGEHVVGCVRPTAPDYTGRTNRLARLQAFSHQEMPFVGGASMLLRDQAWFTESWEGSPRYLDGRRFANILEHFGTPRPVSSHMTPTWTGLFGPHGTSYAKQIAWQLQKSLHSDRKAVYFKTSAAWDVSGEKLLSLFSEVIGFLPLDDRRNATFSTYPVAMPNRSDCLLQGVYVSDKSFQIASATQPWVDCVECRVVHPELLPTAPPVFQTEPSGRVGGSLTGRAVKTDASRAEGCGGLPVVKIVVMGLALALVAAAVYVFVDAFCKKRSRAEALPAVLAVSRKDATAVPESDPIDAESEHSEPAEDSETKDVLPSEPLPSCGESLAVGQMRPFSDLKNARPAGFTNDACKVAYADGEGGEKCERASYVKRGTSLMIDWDLRFGAELEKSARELDDCACVLWRDEQQNVFYIQQNRKRFSWTVVCSNDVVELDRQMFGNSEFRAHYERMMGPVFYEIRWPGCQTNFVTDVARFPIADANEKILLAAIARHQKAVDDCAEAVKAFESPESLLKKSTVAIGEYDANAKKANSAEIKPEEQKRLSDANAVLLKQLNCDTREDLVRKTEEVKKAKEKSKERQSRAEAELTAVRDGFRNREVGIIGPNGVLDCKLVEKVAD